MGIHRAAESFWFSLLLFSEASKPTHQFTKSDNNGTPFPPGIWNPPTPFYITTHITGPLVFSLGCGIKNKDARWKLDCSRRRWCFFRTLAVADHLIGDTHTANQWFAYQIGLARAHSVCKRRGPRLPG